jgi:UDP-glucose 4-epimerase
MKILITGARGNFPLALVPRMLGEGHQLVLFDLEPMFAPEGSVSIQADIRDAAAVTHAMQGCDAVLHAVAYHSDTSDSRNVNDYYSVNVTGTHNILRAMLLHNIKHMVFSSSDEVYGDGMRGVRVMTEDVPCVPTQIFALTKRLSEEMCQYYARVHGFHVAILRYGHFRPADWKTSGMGRLNNWLDREDVAQANELALGMVMSEEIKCETYLIESAKPFVDADWPELESDSAAVVERYYPGATELLAHHGLHVPKIYRRYDISKAVETLGYDPQHNFEQFLSRLRSS